jgi:hypothetical protein
VFPTATEAGAGVIAIEVTVGDLTATVKRVLPDTLPTVAVIVAEPTATPVATPGFAAPVLSTVATAGAEELHVAELVKFLVELSL